MGGTPQAPRHPALRTPAGTRHPLRHRGLSREPDGRRRLGARREALQGLPRLDGHVRTERPRARHRRDGEAARPRRHAARHRAHRRRELLSRCHRGPHRCRRTQGGRRHARRGPARYRDVTLHEIPPNGQGLAALVALGILRHTAVATLPPDSADSLHLQIEAMRAAFVDVHRHVADPDLGTGNARQLLEPAYLQSRAAAIRMDAAGQWNARPFAKSSTVYLAAADAQGPGTGIAMQNRGAGFTLERGHPNEYAPGKRPFHTIIPAFLTRRGQPLAAFGVMGGPMQPQGHVQVVLRMVDQGLNPQSAIDAPRWQVMDDGSILLEPGFPESTVTTLAARGHRVRVDTTGETFFGGAQMAWRGDGSYIAASDPRRDGQAVGF
ncbi:MAG: hypothetical protein EBU31_07790 [Proteobacteria bacterium]|nr:hypothetical protein [Pseudomonadota bacterium]